MSKVDAVDDLSGFSERMREILDIIWDKSNAAKNKKLTKESFAAKEVGTTISSIKRWLDGGTDPSRSNIIRLANASGVNIEWLATGEGPKFKGETAVQSAAPVRGQATDVLGNPVDIDEFVFIPRYDVKAAAGHGYLNDNEKPRFSMAFRKYWVENYLSAAPKDLSVISVKGDSMEGVLNERDNILVDHSKKVPTAGLYVLRIGAELIVKRIQALPGNKLLVISANEAYPPFEIDLTDQTSDFEIIGRVVWFGRQI